MLQALALRYRPRNFDELIGQESVSKSLTHALSENRLTHAYLFSGLRGSGKTSSARIFSKALVCENGPTAKPCEKCSHCIMANESRHIDIIEMDAASHRKIDDIRELIEQTKYSPATARFKIFIIDEVHMLTREAFNALLKTLEEPPSYVKFILATTDPLKLPATVLSRTQHFRFKQISKQNIVKHLEFILSKEGVEYESEALEILARSGSGSLRDTLTLLDQAIVYAQGKLTKSVIADMLGLLDPARIEEIMQIVLSGDRAAMSKVIGEIESYDGEMIIDELIANLKDNFLAQNPKYSLLLYERFFRILSQAKSMLGVTSDNGFVLSVMLFMMMEAINLKQIDDMIASFDVKPQAKIAPLTATVATQKEETAQSVKVASKSHYELFLDKIYDRDYMLGECFKECIEFLDFKDGCLNLISNASGANQERLRASSKVIMEILRSNFGPDAKIKIVSKEQNLADNKLAQNENLEARAEQENLEPIHKSQISSNERNLKPYLGNLRDNSEDFITAYSPKSETAQAYIAPELAMIDAELERIEKSKTQEKPQEIKPEFTPDEASDDDISQNLKQNLAEISEPIITEPKPTSNLKNEAILKEAKRLFGEPQILDMKASV